MYFFIISKLSYEKFKYFKYKLTNKQAYYPFQRLIDNAKYFFYSLFILIVIKFTLNSL